MRPTRECRTHPGAVTALLLVALVVGNWSSASAAEPEPLTGDLRVDQDLRVEEGDTLLLGPNTTLEGTGRVLVYGRLVAEGTEAEPVTFRVPVYVFQTEGTMFRHSRFEGIAGFAILLEGGTVQVEQSTFDGRATGDVAIKVLPDGRSTSLSITDSSFHGYYAAAIDAATSGPTNLSIERARFEDNEIGLRSNLLGAHPVSVTVRDSVFARQVSHHLRFDLRERGGQPGHVLIAGNRIVDLAGGPEQDESIISALKIREHGDAADASPELTHFVSRENTYGGNARGVHLYSARNGSTYSFVSIGDVFEGNGVGIQAHHTSMVIEGGTFRDNAQWDLFVPYAPGAGAPVVEIRNSTYTVAQIGVAPGAGAIATDDGIIRGAAIVAVGGIGALGLATVLFKSSLRQMLLQVMFVPLYARLKAGEILAHEKRRSIVDYVTANPGAHMRRIGHALEISYGALTYHIYRLEKEGYLTSREEGLFKRFYPSTGGAKAKASSTPMPTALRRLERDILNAIIEEPGQPQSGVATKLGLSRQALHYHIKKLESRSFIVKVPQGRETLLYAREEAVTAAREASEAQAVYEGGLDDAEGTRAAAADGAN